MTWLVVFLVLAGCAAAPARPTEAERAAAFHQQVMAGLRSLEAYCATRPDPRACERAVLQVWSRPVVLPSAPSPPQTIIIQQPPVPRHRETYWGPRTPYGVPSVPGIVPVYPIE